MPEEIQQHAEKACDIIDALVDAVGEPSVSLYRIMTLIDIDQNPDTTQTEIGQRLDIEKSAIARNVDWLINYGCVTKHFSAQDARENLLQIAQYSKNHLEKALAYTNNDHKSLQNFLLSIIKGFNDHKPTLRDAKILMTVGKHEIISKADVVHKLYNGPASTDNRAFQVLNEEGLIEKNG